MDNSFREKKCPRCGEVKPADRFNRCRASRTGLSSYCKACVADYARENRHRRRAWHETSLDKRRAAARRYRLKTKYGLTTDQYEAMLASQNGVCAICEREEPGGNGVWHVDHCHRGGRVRGLLCQSCNLALGHFRDDPELLIRASRYLSESTIVA